MSNPLTLSMWHPKRRVRRLLKAKATHDPPRSRKVTAMAERHQCLYVVHFGVLSVFAPVSSDPFPCFHLCCSESLCSEHLSRSGAKKSFSEQIAEARAQLNNPGLFSLFDVDDMLLVP